MPAKISNYFSKQKYFKRCGGFFFFLYLVMKICRRMFVTAGVALPVASVLGPMDAATGP